MKTAVIGFLFCLVLPAQDFQNRSVVHVQADLNRNWFVPVWSISNFKTETPNNTNTFAGIGYRGQTWWLEVMEQEQWKLGDVYAVSPLTGQWTKLPSSHFRALDVRLAKTFNNGCALYLEPSPFKGGIYEFAFAECPVWKKINAGIETEDVQHSGPDVIALGGRVSRQVKTIGPVQTSAAIAVRADPTGRGRTELRLYLVGNIRLARKR